MGVSYTDHVAIIDGTGPSDETEYKNAMTHSFCRQLGNKIGRSYYQRGPTALGGETDQLAQRAVNWMVTRQCRGNDRYFLIGYSRGGSSALMAAEALKKQANLKVSGLILFDPVHMHIEGAVHGIPSNVEQSLTFIRPLDAQFPKTWADTIYDEWVPNWLGAWVDNPVRPGWTENSEPPKGAQREKHQRFQIKGSHGALGGVGWKHMIDVDAPAQARIAKTTNDALSQWGFTQKVVSSKPASVSELPPGTEIKAKRAKSYRTISRDGRRRDAAIGRRAALRGAR